MYLKKKETPQDNLNRSVICCLAFSSLWVFEAHEESKRKSAIFLIPWGSPESEVVLVFGTLKFTILSLGRSAIMGTQDLRSGHIIGFFSETLVSLGLMTILQLFSYTRASSSHMRGLFPGF